MMRFHRAIAFVGAVAMTAAQLSARSVSPDEAARRVSASEAAPRHIAATAPAMKLAGTIKAAEKADAPAVYMFTRPDGSYVIAPGDDEFPAVLGYGDGGAFSAGGFDPDNMPPAMKWWLEEYSRQMQAALNATPAPAPAIKSVSDPSMKAMAFTAIAPLLTTTWNQDRPFNNQTISIMGEQAVTGCVATSTAQVMKYHNWPVTGTGSHSYTWSKYTNVPAQTLSCDFSRTTFDWANMLDHYSEGGYSTTQAKAVSTLMHAVDVAVEMNFGQVADGGSGAFHSMARDALVNYFRYSRAAHIENRSSYSFAQWEELIYSNLARRLPVIMEGYATAGGHSFVCDGYSSNHYFHINWGWGGLSDGYFMLCALSPDSQGIGSFEGGYNSMQGIICDIMPVRDGNDPYSDPEAFMSWNGDFKFAGYNLGRWNFDCGTEVWAEIFNGSTTSFSGDLGVIIEEASGNRTFHVAFTTSNFAPNHGYSSAYFNIYEPALADGTYRVYPAYRLAGDSEAQLMHNSPSNQQYVILTVNGSEYTFSDPVRDLELFGVHVGVPDNIYRNSAVEFTVSVANLSETIDFEGDMRLVISSDSRAADEVHTFRMAVPAHLTLGMTIGVTVARSAGNYTVRLQDDKGRDISDSYPITVKAGSEPVLTTDLQVSSLSPTTVGTSGPYTFNLIATNTATAPIDEGFTVKVLDKKGAVKYSRPHDDYYYQFPAKQTYAITIADWNTNFAAGEYYIEVVGRKYANYRWGADEVISKLYPLTVGTMAESVELSHEEVTLNESDTHTLTAAVWPADARDRTVTWRSSKPEVASVDANGRVTALHNGKATIIASTSNGKAGLCTVTVNSPTGIDSIVTDPAETIIGVYAVDGKQVLSYPAGDDLGRLDKGIYIVKTDRRSYKVAL